MRSSKIDYTGGVSMLPLVDILFSSAGIFLILISVLYIIQTKINRPPPTADMVVVCTSDDQYTIYSQNEAMGVKKFRTELMDILLNTLKERDVVLSLLIAFDEDSFSEKDRFMKSIKKMRTRIKKTDPLVYAHIETMLWPLSKPGTLPPLVLKWQEEKHLGKPNDN